MDAARGDAGFSTLLSENVVVRFDLDVRSPRPRTLPDGFRLGGESERQEVREAERRLLKLEFEHWRVPYEGGLPGWRRDSPLYVLQGQRLACGAYLCAGNEFDDDAAIGQLHYNYTDRDVRRLGLYACLFEEALRRARGWGLKTVLINTDRKGLPEMYLRWGGAHWRTLPKPPRPRLIQRLRRRLRDLKSRLA